MLQRWEKFLKAFTIKQINLKLLFTLISLAVIPYSCSFPNKSTKQTAIQVSKDITFLKPLILTELIQETSLYNIDEIQNDSLRDYLKNKAITELSIQYNTRNDDFLEPLRIYTFDSLITFHKNKSKNGRYIYEDIIYSFSVKKPNINSMKSIGITVKQLNDSVWFLKTDLQNKSMY